MNGSKRLKTGKDMVAITKVQGEIKKLANDGVELWKQIEPDFETLF